MEDMRNTNGKVVSKINPLLKLFAKSLNNLQAEISIKNQE